MFSKHLVIFIVKQLSMLMRYKYIICLIANVFLLNYIILLGKILYNCICLLYIFIPMQFHMGINLHEIEYIYV